MRRLAALAGLALSCAPPPAAPPAPTAEEWTAARGVLAALRARAPDRPYVERVSVALREPRSGRVFEARGALAVKPGRAVRMILIGPGGATAVDLWVTPERWWMHAPALGPPRAGEEAPPELPVGFFRWWFLAPFEGRLLALDRGRAILRSGGATVSLGVAATRGGALRIEMSRRAAGREETLEWAGSASGPAAGERARYAAAGGVAVDVVVESVSFELEDDGAFADPAAGQGSPR